jgi:hypothetical protein
MKQTAVEWLASNLDIIWEEKIIDLVEQAKQMEKEQIIQAFNSSAIEQPAEQYYKQTFKSEKIETKQVERIPCPQCQGGGCPFCQGYGNILKL